MWYCKPLIGRRRTSYRTRSLQRNDCILKTNEMRNIHTSLAYGNTPLVELRKVVPPGSARVVAKLEWANPTGSMKDRMARAAIEHAEADERLRRAHGRGIHRRHDGISLAFVCAAKGYGLEIVFSDAFSDEKRRTMLAYGARVTDVPSENKRITESLIKGMIAKAAEISLRPGHWQCDQLNNHDAIQGYLPLGEELWRRPTAARRVRAGGEHRALDSRRHAGAVAHNDRIRIVAVEPAESAVLSGGPSDSHRIEGIGIGFIPRCGTAAS